MFGCHGNSIENMCDIVVSTVAADGLAPLGARPSAGTVMSKFGSRIVLCIIYMYYIYTYIYISSNFSNISRYNSNISYH